jgi:hypothetical protein
MKTRWGLIILATFIMVGVASAAVDSPPGQGPQRADARQAELWHGQPVGLAKAKADTVYLMGGRDRLDGKFQDDVWDAFPDPEGWYGVDLTQRTDPIWHISTFNAALLDEGTPSNHAMWCGEYFLPCSGEPENPGYGNNYNEYLDWYGIVPNYLASTQVTVQARLNYDNEEGYDLLYLEVDGNNGMSVVETWNGSNKVEGVFVPVDVNAVFTVTPQDYVGGNHDQIHLRWHFQSDGAWSDQDCWYPTDGGAQLDNVLVKFNGTPWAMDDFEPGNWVNWQVAYPTGVGDFAWTWPALEDVDDCAVNRTPQWGFIDDGNVLEGTGGYPCVTWCYGPRGYIVNPEGGLAGPQAHLTNEIFSPKLQWPEGDYDGAVFSFDVYRHEPLATLGSPGVFYVWHVQSTTDPTGQSGWSGWSDRNFVYYGGPDYIRDDQVVTDLLLPGRKYVQLALGVTELGWVWGYEGTDGTPAPYFDNVAFKVYSYTGPAITGREIEMAQDNFPAIGAIDPGNPAANRVRFDMAMNIALPEEGINLPGDSVVFDVQAVRTGSALHERPRLHYNLRPNHLFDAARTSGLPLVGSVEGDTIRTPGGAIVPDRWAFDLPDSGFFFPGDIIHYYIQGRDNLGGDITVSRLPGDTTGFAAFPGDPDYLPMRYPTTFVVRALPNLHSFTPDDQPRILFWNDFGARGGENEWYYALSHLGFLETVDYDVYHTNGPSSGVGNGLGGRATATQLAGYETLLYSSGDLAAFTISNGDWQNDAGNDVDVLDNWLLQGNKQMFLTGDEVVFDLQQSGAATLAFKNNWISVSLLQQEVRPLIDGQSVPTVRPLADNPVFIESGDWLADGACPILNYFDAVIPTGNAVALAEFLDLQGDPSQYPYAAAVLHVEPNHNNTVIYLPYDFMYISDPASGTQLKAPPGTSPRTLVMEEVLRTFGYLPGSPIIGVPDYGDFAIHENYPNPFNPTTSIAYNMPRSANLSIKIYNVRGQLVRTLIDEVVPAGPGAVDWDGSDDRGEAAASGIYFYESLALGKRSVQKMALVK